jgi:hypothetical protein
LDSSTRHVSAMDVVLMSALKSRTHGRTDGAAAKTQSGHQHPDFWCQLSAPGTAWAKDASQLFGVAGVHFPVF